MQLESSQFYHLNNRSNRGLIVYQTTSNYNYFLFKVEKEWKPYFDIVAYCLMPTHFHFIVHTPPKIIIPKTNYAVGKLLSSYTRAMNKEFETHGSLFQRKTSVINLYIDEPEYIEIFAPNIYAKNCFNYIHQNPDEAGLVIKPEDWLYSFLTMNTSEKRKLKDCVMLNWARN